MSKILELLFIEFGVIIRLLGAETKFIDDRASELDVVSVVVAGDCIEVL